MLEVVPRQVAFIQQVDHQVKDRLHIVTAWLVVAATRIQGGEEKVTAKLVHEFFFNMRSIIVQVLLGKAEVNQVLEIRVVESNYDVFELNVIVDEAQLVQFLDALDLRDKG